MPASRWGQDLSSVYVQLWLDRYVSGGANDGYDPWLNASTSHLFPIDAGHAAMATEIMRSFIPALGVPFDGGVLGAGKVYELVRVPYSSSQVALSGAAEELNRTKKLYETGMASGQSLAEMSAKVQMLELILQSAD